MAESFKYESENISVALSAISKKRYLTYLNGGYSLSQKDIDILRACAENASFQGDQVTNATSLGEYATCTRAYSRTRAVLRALNMMSKTRLDYVDAAVKAAEKDEVFYAGRTASDISLHRDLTETPDTVNLAEGFSEH